MSVPASPERPDVNATASRALIEETKKSGVLLQEIAMSGRLRISDATDVSAAGLLCEHVAEQLEAAKAERAKQERLAGNLRGLFRRKMREWADHFPSYSYGEADVEEFLLEAERDAASSASSVGGRA